MEHTQLMLAKVRKVKAKRAKAAVVKSRMALRKRSRKGKKVSKKHTTRRSKAIKKRGRKGKKVRFPGKFPPGLPIIQPTLAQCKEAMAKIKESNIPLPPEIKKMVLHMCKRYIHELS